MAVSSVRCALMIAIVACTPARRPMIGDARFPSTDGGTRPLIDHAARFTVIEFFSTHCPCQAKHDERLRRLAALYQRHGVAFVAVNSEANASATRDRDEAARRHYPYPILSDPEGAAASALQADYATYSVIIDATGAPLYRGGIDSDRNRMHDDATPYLENAIVDALAGRAVRVPNAKSLGCSLMLK